VATLAVWMLGALLFGTVLALEAGNTHDLVSQGCPRPNDSSEMLAPSHWSWLPPGEVCEFPNGDARPSSARLVVTCSLAAIPILVVMLWPKSRRAVLINA
jgi:hypothetical protein